MLKKEMMYSLRDISIIPSVITDIRSRSECNPYRPSIAGDGDELLPVITAPMSCVLNELNFHEFLENGVNVIIPRTVDLNIRKELMFNMFCAFSMSEAANLLEEFENVKLGEEDVLHVLIDNANGHMRSHIELGKKMKRTLKDHVLIMGGNIANPNTYLSYEFAGFDYVRASIGSGNCCITATQTSCHYAMASLIADICELRPKDYHCKVIADGGIGGYSDIIKCLALGADYVMCGKLFAKAALSGEEIGDSHLYYGMSTKMAQKEMGNTKLKTSEGRKETVIKEYTLPGWTENLHDYICSAMSYCDSRSLDEFREKAVCRVLSPAASSLINDK